MPKRATTLALATSTTILLYTFAFLGHHTWMYDSNILITLACMSVTHFVLYPFIWYFPNVWRKLFGDVHCVRVFGLLVFMQKILLLCVFTKFWVWPNLDSIKNLYLSENNMYSFSLLLVIPAIAWAAWLQSLVYKQIGNDGVYYGFKMGKEVPWCTEFPFNSSYLRHPQYISAFTVSACCLIALGPQWEYLLFGAFQFWAYTVTAVMEESGDADAQDAAKQIGEGGQEKAGSKEGAKKETRKAK